MNSKLIQIAAAEIGVREIAGADHNERILHYADEVGLDWINDDETPWCSIFMNWVATEADVEQSERANARSWLNVGRAVTDPEPGDVVIFWRESPHSWKGHVGLYMGFSRDQARTYVLGGNQGDQVGISAYASEKVLGFRRLLPEGDIELSARTLQNGDRGPAVRDLQDALKIVGFSPGTSDGIFGPHTEAAVKALQATNSQLEIDGVFGPETSTYLLDLINGSNDIR